MIWHPLALAIWILDALAWLIAIVSLVQLIHALPGWDASAANRQQLAREQSLELVLFLGRWLFGLQAGAFVLLVIGISNAWPGIIPGAMCGAGVLQAMGPAGQHTLIVRAVTVLGLAAWQAAAGFCRRTPDIALWPMMGRALLPTLPFMVLGTVTWTHAISATTPGQTVHCCALVYSTAGETTLDPTPSPVIAHGLLIWAGIGALAIAALSLAQRRRSIAARPANQVFVTLGTLAWIPIATLTVRDTVAPYVYEVLSHRCLWCLFLTEHNGVGFLLFGTIGMIGMELSAALASGATMRRSHAAARLAHFRIRRALFGVAAAAVIFFLTAITPVLKWRWTFGQWLF